MLKKRILTILCFFCLLPACLHAQQAEESIIEFFSTDATMEDDPKKGNYNITIFSPDGQWKMQLNYNSTSMFGTFGNEEFNLSGDGRYYNFARNPKNDMVFYSFKDMQVTVADEGTQWRVNANCLASNNTRFKVEATIEAPKAKETVSDDLGFARVEPNPFYGTYIITAENENYSLKYGVVGDDVIGTFYRADILLPELYDIRNGKSISIRTASAVHTKPEGQENTDLVIDILSEDLINYHLTMYNGPFDVEIEEEIDVNINGGILQDLHDMYGCYQFAGANEDYQIGLAILPEAMESGRTEWNKDDFIMQFTNMLDVAEGYLVPIYDIHATLEKGEKMATLKIELTTMDGVLYHITMILQMEGYMPQPTETVNIDFGHISVLDYTKGLGIVGIGAIKPGQYQLRAYLYTPRLEGEFTTADFEMDLCDIMVVNGESYVFHDAKYTNAKMEKDENGKTQITIDMYGIDDVLYHATMYIDPLSCMNDTTYSIGYLDDVMMMAIAEGGDDDYTEYTMQFQNLDNVYDENYNIIGDGYYFSFYFAHEGNGIGGKYGYSEGTLAEDEYHGIYENGCEVRIAPVAGTLNVEPLQEVTLNLGTQLLKTNIYKVGFQFLGQNGAIYSAEGQNFLLCINEEGEFKEITEDILQSIRESLAEQGYQVRKVLKNGKLVIEAKDREYDLQGRKNK